MLAASAHSATAEPRSPRAIAATRLAAADPVDRIREHLHEQLAAVADGSPVTLVDDKGKKVLIPGAKLAYAEVSTEEPRRVGFLVTGDAGSIELPEESERA